MKRQPLFEAEGISFSLRQPAEEDLPRCGALIRESFGGVAREFGLTPENCPTNTAFMPDEQLAEKFAQKLPMFLAEADGVPAGFFMLEEDRFAENAQKLEKLAVLPRFRHHGLGRALLDAAAAQARALGAERLTIGIIEENTRLKNWYLANGFVHTGTKRFDHLPFTAGFMEKIL